jgi:dTDP-4-amino-4,6-dideoxy-D-galactose acyltransferase
MNPEKAAPCELLSWDTEFFGNRIARVRGDTLDDAAASRIDDWCAANRIEALYFLGRADVPQTIQAAERHGFGLVDVRVTYRLSSVELPKIQPRSAAVAIRTAGPDDIPALREIARGAHRDSRFFNDPHFPREKAGQLYETWIDLECSGRADQVLVVANETGHAVGYLSCHLEKAGSAGSIGLLGVHQDFQGRGAGSELVFAALRWFLAQGMQQVSVVTQAHNIKAQRLYQRYGFLTENVQLWYHKWYSPDATGKPPGRGKESV